ncbi:hypothetical protein Vadar_025006 [Vaccinium darrowii]|uniref:Uncharacterized protein n=1 Tax=Vaccinium darrowii TaxID=229202 RepID=A0ACB7Y9Y4_9ERIC|nr:hypothetical protein Vadar_025006 [Vaccinium darrowii]
MCRNNFRHELSTVLMAQTFEGFNDLWTKAHDMELHLSKRRRPRVVDRLETSMTVLVETKKGGPIVVGAPKPKEAKKATMKERLENNYSFIDDLVEDMFEDLLEKKLITLPEVKRPHEEGKTTHPKYYSYHRHNSHTKMDHLPVIRNEEKRSSSFRTKAPFVPKRPQKPKTSKKIKRTKVSKSAAKKKGPKNQKREKLVSAEPLKQSLRILSDEEEEEEGEEEEEEGSSVSCPIHILDSPTSSHHNFVVEECMAILGGCMTPEGTMASPDFSPVPPCALHEHSRVHNEFTPKTCELGSHESAFIQSQYFYRWDSQFLRSARERYPQEGEVITDDEHSSVGSTNMVQISDEPKEGDNNG